MSRTQATGGGGVSSLAELDSKNHSDLDNIQGNGEVHLSSTEKSNYDTAYNHSQNNNQAHSDYLKNNADDETTGKLTAKQFEVNYTGTSSFDDYTAIQSVDWTSGFDSNTYRMNYISQSYTTEAGTFGVPKIYGISINQNITNNGAGFFSPDIKAIKVNTTVPSSMVSNYPFVEMKYSGGPADSSDGVYFFSATTTGGSTTIALKSFADVDSGNAMGYQGYGKISNGSGYVIGVQGVSALLGGTPQYSVGLDGNGNITSSSVLTKDYIMGVRSNGHLLVTSGSVIASSSGYKPADITPNHLDFANNYGELYVDGKSEFKDTVYSDAGNFYKIETKTADYTATTNDRTVLVDASSGAVTITLPNVTDAYESPSGQIITIKKIDSSVNNVVISAGSSTIDGSSTKTLSTQYDKITIQCDGNNWWVI